MRNETIALTFAAVLGFAGLAHADAVSARCGESHLSGAVTSCAGEAEFGWDSRGADITYFLEFTAPAAHCSAVRYTATTYDNSEAYGPTRWLNAGERIPLKIGNGYAAGRQGMRISAEGRVGGCNAGVMESWGADIRAIAR